MNIVGMNGSLNRVFIEIMPSGGGDDNWYLKTERVSHNTISFVLLFFGIGIYWALFSVWATLNIYHLQRLNIFGS